VKNLAGGTLVVLGVLIAVLGLFVAGNIAIVGVGLIAIFGGGVLEALTRRQG
jgi:hypothetical protein